MNAYKSRMQRFAQRVLPDAIGARESPSDVVQQTLIEAVRARAKFRGAGPSEVAPWLFGILKNRVRQAIRRHAGVGRRSVGREVSLTLIGSGELPPAPGVESSVAAGPRARAKTVIAGLPEQERQLLHWRIDEDLPFAEIGRRLGISEDAARHRHTRLMAELRQRLSEHARIGAPPIESA